MEHARTMLRIRLWWLVGLSAIARADSPEDSYAPVDRTLVDDLQGRISSLERRLRAIEQPGTGIYGLF
jgi:hypothetical protein